MSNRLRERPLRRVNPSGKVMWVARVTRPDGRREAYKPGWNSGKGTFLTRGEAQRAIDEYYDERYGKLTETVATYFERWPKKHPRAARTQATNEHRVSRTLDIEIEGRKLRDWPLVDLRPSPRAGPTRRALARAGPLGARRSPHGVPARAVRLRSLT